MYISCSLYSPIFFCDDFFLWEEKEEEKKLFTFFCWIVHGGYFFRLYQARLAAVRRLALVSRGVVSVILSCCAGVGRSLILSDTADSDVIVASIRFVR
ncbi:unnamed protein product [Macrosiphum euphorbiae]|uniref:Uncharacterized protein n=1 Tax=Macrosiphum euphorbiae TaxID=13131 RepID=A0AAV0XSP5_9HEMI|nr:unnamed protein product [Macrosiphum euphorbiae]